MQRWFGQPKQLNVLLANRSAESFNLRAVQYWWGRYCSLSTNDWLPTILSSVEVRFRLTSIQSTAIAFFFGTVWNNRVTDPTTIASLGLALAD